MKFINPAHVFHRIFNIKKELGEIYINLTILTFAIALIGVYIPIHMLILGFSLNSVFYFMLVSWAIVPISSILVGYLASKIGIKFTIFLRSPTLILLLGLITLLDPVYGIDVRANEFLTLTILGLINGFSLATYWVLINSEFVKYSDRLHEGRDIGYMYALTQATSIAAPIAGGIILSYMGFGTLFLIVSFLIIFSATPLFFLNEYKGSIKFSLKEIKFLKNANIAMLFISEGIIFVAEALIWPLFIFTKYPDIVTLGIAISLSEIGILIITLVTARLIDMFGKKSLLNICAIFYVMLWVARLFAGTTVEIFILSFFGGLLILMLRMPVFAIFCDVSREKPINSSIYREFWLNIGRSLILIFALFATFKFEISFIIAALASLLMLFVVNRPGSVK